jgi:6-phosphogluconolactonase
MSMKKYELMSFSSPDALALAAATAWLDEIEAANRKGELHSVALSGGRITQKFFSETVKLARARRTDLDQVHFFWADERCLPPTDPESNFKLANELLFAPLNVSEKNIHRLRGEDEPAEAVKKAETELREIVSLKKNNLPVLDLILLGMGEDGHVASLFPILSDPFLDIFVPFLVVKNSPKPPPTRISLSYKMIFAAKNIWILASGAGKEAVFQKSLQPDGDTPMARVIKAGTATKIFSDLANVTKNNL